MERKYIKRARIIARDIQHNWSINYAQAYQMAWETDLILKMVVMMEEGKL